MFGPNPNIRCKTCPKHSEECDRLAKAEKDKPVNGRTHHIKTDSLCWCCKKSVIGGCGWIDKQEPVRHWDADFDIHASFESYHVNNCPEFERG